MIIDIKIKTKEGRLTMNGKTYPELTDTEKGFLNDLLRTIKRENEIPV